MTFDLPTGLNHTLELSELTRAQLEEEIQNLVKDKQEVIQQLNVVSFVFVCFCFSLSSTPTLPWLFIEYRHDSET